MASFNERLVREVKKHRQLWNQNYKLYKEPASREAAWKDIASALGVTVDDCQTRWRTIRDSYLKRKKRQQVMAKGQWNVLGHELSFLDDFLRPRTRSLIRLTAVKSEPEDEASPGGSASLVPLQLPEAEYSADLELSLLPEVTPPTPMPLSPPASVSEQHSLDREELFCLSLVPQFKSLPPRERNQAKIWILQMLHNLEYGLTNADVGSQTAGIAVGNVYV